MPWITAKTDWTAADYYNFDDINRVENNTEYVRSELLVIGYVSPSMTFIKDRTDKSYDLVSSINRIEANLQTLVNNFVEPPGWLPSITWTQDTKFNAYHANRWENNLSLIHEYAALTEQAFRYAGTFPASEGVTIL